VLSLSTSPGICKKRYKQTYFYSWNFKEEKNQVSLSKVFHESYLKRNKTEGNHQFQPFLFWTTRKNVSLDSLQKKEKIIQVSIYLAIFTIIKRSCSFENHQLHLGFFVLFSNLDSIFSGQFLTKTFPPELPNMSNVFF